MASRLPRHEPVGTECLQLLYDVRMTSKQQTQAGRERPRRCPGPTGPEIQHLIDEAGKAVVDGAYVAVGFGVLGLQRAQVRRRRLQKAATSTIPPRLDEIGRAVAANADATRAQLCARLRAAAGLD